MAWYKIVGELCYLSEYGKKRYEGRKGPGQEKGKAKKTAVETGANTGPGRVSTNNSLLLKQLNSKGGSAVLNRAGMNIRTKIDKVKKKEVQLVRKKIGKSVLGGNSV